MQDSGPPLQQSAQFEDVTYSRIHHCGPMPEKVEHSPAAQTAIFDGDHHVFQPQTLDPFDQGAVLVQ
jgi:hypothetical protein